MTQTAQNSQSTPIAPLTPLTQAEIDTYALGDAEALSLLASTVNPSRALRLRAHAAALRPVYDGELPPLVQPGAARVWRLEDAGGQGPWAWAGPHRHADWTARMPVQNALGAPHHSGLPLRTSEGAELVTGAPSYELLEDWFAPVWDQLRGLRVCEYQVWAPDAYAGPLQVTFNRAEARLVASWPAGPLRQGAGFDPFHAEAAGILLDVAVKFAWSDAMVRQFARDHLTGAALEQILAGPRGAEIARR